MTRKNSFEPFEEIHRSVYMGRRRLGAYTQTGKSQFEAFDAAGQRLGVFRTEGEALSAIGEGRG